MVLAFYDVYTISFRTCLLLAHIFSSLVCSLQARHLTPNLSEPEKTWLSPRSLSPSAQNLPPTHPLLAHIALQAHEASLQALRTCLQPILSSLTSSPCSFVSTFVTGYTNNNQTAYATTSKKTTTMLRTCLKRILSSITSSPRSFVSTFVAGYTNNNQTEYATTFLCVSSRPLANIPHAITIIASSALPPDPPNCSIHT